MTTITIPLDVAEAASDSLGNFVMDHGWSDADMQAMDNLDAYIARHKANQSALAASATAPEKTVKEIMEFARHYAADTFSSATLEDKIRRSLAAPATAPAQPAWHDAPTAPGTWILSLDSGMEVQENITQHEIDIEATWPGGRWYGPIPEDKL